MSEIGQTLKSMFNDTEFYLYYCHRDEYYDFVNNSQIINWREFTIDDKQVLKNAPQTTIQNFNPIAPSSFQNNYTIQLCNWSVPCSSANVNSENHYVLWSVLMQKYGLIFDGRKFVSGRSMAGTYKAYRFQDLVFQIRVLTAGREDVLFTGFPQITGAVTSTTITVKVRSTVEELAKYPCDDIKDEYNGYYSNLTFGDASNLLKSDYMNLIGDTDDIVFEDEYGRLDTFVATKQTVLSSGQTDNYFWYATSARAVIIEKTNRRTEYINIDDVYVRYIYEHNGKVYAVLQTSFDGHGNWCNTYIRCWSDNKDTTIMVDDRYIGRAYNSLALKDSLRPSNYLVKWTDEYSTRYVKLTGETVSQASPYPIPFYEFVPTGGFTGYQPKGFVGAVQIASSQGNFISGAGSYTTCYCPSFFYNNAEPPPAPPPSLRLPDVDYYLANDGYVGTGGIAINGLYTFTEYDQVHNGVNGSGGLEIRTLNKTRTSVSGRADFIYSNGKLYAVLAPTTAPNSTSASSPYTGYVKEFNNYGMYPIYAIDGSVFTKTLVASQNNLKLVDWILDVNDSSIAVCSFYNHFDKSYSIKQLNLTTGTISDYRSTSIASGANYTDHYYGLYIDQNTNLRHFIFNKSDTTISYLNNSSTLTDYDMSSVASVVGASLKDGSRYICLGKKPLTKNIITIDVLTSTILQDVTGTKLEDTDRILYTDKDFSTGDSISSCNNYIIDIYDNVRIQLFDLSSFGNRLQAFLELVSFSNKLMSTTPDGNVYFSNINNLPMSFVNVDDDDIVSASINYGYDDELKKYLIVNSNYINGKNIYNKVVRNAKNISTILDTDLDFYVLPTVIDTCFSMVVEVTGSSSFRYKIISTNQKIPYGWRTVTVSDWNDIEFTIYKNLAVHLSFNFTPSKGDQYDYTCNNKKLDKTSNTNRTEINPTVKIENAVTIDNKFIYASIENAFAKNIKDYYIGQKLQYNIVLNYPLVLERIYGSWLKFDPTKKIKITYSPFDIYEQEVYVLGYNINWENNTTTLRLLEV